MHNCLVCGKSYKRRFDLQRHMKDKHAESEYECYMCNRKFHRKNLLNDHLKREHDVVMHDNEYEEPTTAPPLQRTHAIKPDTDEVPSYSKWDVKPYDVFKGVHSSTKSSPYQFKHPFCMMVAGPSRSGKTQWVTKLLMTKEKRIHPTPDRIVYCYRHWQKLYSTLRMHDPAILWH